jgi:DNA-binding CsgD family transcriptional regulator/TolB-like protein
VSVTLSSRERACLSWASQGKSSWDIGAILAISENTVNFHIKNAMRKLQTTSRTVAAIKAMHFGLIPAPSKLESLHRSQAPYCAAPSHDRRAGRSVCKCRVMQLSSCQSFPSGADRNRIKVGVLPFLALQSLRHKALASSFTQEIAVGLAQFRWLHVTGPTASKDEGPTYFVDDDLPGREFDYLVDGALWNQFDALQICVRLLNVVDGTREMWSEHFKFASIDRYQLDDRTISHIAEQLDLAAQIQSAPVNFTAKSTVTP